MDNLRSQGSREHVLQKGVLRKQFREAICIMQVIPRNHALQDVDTAETSNPLLRDRRFQAQLVPSI